MKDQPPVKGIWFAIDGDGCLIDSEGVSQPGLKTLYDVVDRTSPDLPGDQRYQSLSVGEINDIPESRMEGIFPGEDPVPNTYDFNLLDQDRTSCSNLFFGILMNREGAKNAKKNYRKNLALTSFGQRSEVPKVPKVR